MNNYNKMKELIQTRKLQEALLLAFSNSLTLKITTKSTADEQQEIKTVIDLLQGITNRISDPNLMDNRTKNNSEAIDIVDFHEQQKESVYELWHKNRETIIGILQIISGLPIEINTLKKVEKKVISINKKQEDNIEEFNVEQNEQNENFEAEENSLEDNNWVNGIVDDIVGETEEEIISEEENWDDFVMEEDNEAEVIINAQEEDNWDEFMDGDYSEDSIINSNGTSPDNSSEEEEWQEWLEEESPLEEDSIVNENEVVANELSNLEVGDEWQEWLEDENNIAMEEQKDEIDC